MLCSLVTARSNAVLHAPMKSRSRSSTKVIINGRFAAQAQTGVQRYAFESVRAMDALLAERAELAHLFDVQIALPDHGFVEGLEKITPVRVGGAANHLWEQFWLLRAAKDAILLNLNYSGPLLKRDQIVTIHDATVCVFPESFSRMYRWLHLTMVAVLKQRAAQVMTVSNFSKFELRQHFNITDAVVGTEGWQHSAARGDSAAVLTKYGLVAGQYLFAAGSIKPNKNFSIIGKALRLLHDYPIKFAIAGAHDISIFAQDDLAGGDTRIQMLGYVPEEDLPHLYRNAAWFVFPSLYEGFGLPAIEAMANGCPIIAADAASIPEVCGDAALYIDPHRPESLADVLTRIIQEPDLRDKMREKIPARLALFSWRRNAAIIFSQLAQLAGNVAAKPIVEDLHAAPLV